MKHLLIFKVLYTFNIEQEKRRIAAHTLLNSAPPIDQLKHHPTKTPNYANFSKANQ